jgi:hypothetical protein
MKTATASIATLAHGAVIEMVDDAIRKVAENILDPNTEPDARRSIVLTLNFAPSKNRDVVGITFEVATKPAKDKPASTSVFLTKNRAGSTQLTEHNPQQDELFEEVPARHAHNKEMEHAG